MDEPSVVMGAIGVGTVLAETYEITELLGKGGMGTVWAAKHLRLPGKRVAIKVLHGVAANDRESYARFRREAEIASRIGHPNIVTVHDFNVLPSGTPYLVLEFLDGEDLAQRLARGKLPLETAMGIARQIGSALHAAHKADVVHRDLKPGNVFLQATEIGGELVDQVKVLDFGISKIRGSQTVQTQDSVLLGTPQYMAPEQALGKNTELDARTDIFALAAIVYEMVSGRAAFSGATLAEVVFKVVYDKPAPLPADVPPNVAAAVEQALAKDPNQRFSDVAAFINALTGRPLQTLDRARARNPAPEAFAATALPSKSPSPPSTGARGEAIPATNAPQKSRTNAWVFLAALVVAVIGGVGALQILKGPPPRPHAQPIATPPPPPATTTPEKPPVELHAATPTQPIVPAEPHTKAATKKESLPADVVAELDAAEKEIDADPADAIRQARHTLSTAKSSRAYSIVARAFCKQGDLGNAKATLHNVGAADRARVVKYCKAAGTDLD